eukprot:TRINITY_DN268_c8_g1_i1.p1 TRINITY_DN268_c8_g1~~TRINITY_DN268_c8_g1_i1.p1  ORF type:complete len:279 (+),score=35.53 TRINITY_DN268_c8_g1_i1:49-837(+)
MDAAGLVLKVAEGISAIEVVKHYLPSGICRDLVMVLGVSAPWLTKRTISRQIGGAGGDKAWEIHTPTPSIPSIVLLIVSFFGGWYSLFHRKLISQTKLIIGAAVCVIPFLTRTTSSYKYIHWAISDTLSSFAFRLLAYTSLIAGHYIYAATFEEKQTQAKLTQRINSRSRSRSLRSSGSQRSMRRDGSTGSIRSIKRDLLDGIATNAESAANSPENSPRLDVDHDFGPLNETTRSSRGHLRNITRKRTSSASSFRRSRRSNV